MYMYVYIYIYIHIHISLSLYTYIYIYTYYTHEVLLSQRRLPGARRLRVVGLAQRPEGLLLEAMHSDSRAAAELSSSKNRDRQSYPAAKTETDADAAFAIRDGQGCS